MSEHYILNYQTNKKYVFSCPVTWLSLTYNTIKIIIVFCQVVFFEVNILNGHHFENIQIQVFHIFVKSVFVYYTSSSFFVSSKHIFRFCHLSTKMI